MRATRCRPDLAAGLGVDEGQLADVGQVGLAGIVDLDRDDVMAGGQAGQRSAPVARAAEVGDEDDETAARRGRVRDPERLGGRGDADALLDASPPAPRAAAPSRPVRPAAGGTRRSRDPPNVTIPRRLPRWVARWPIATATPSATSALRRSAVPKVIDGETSSRSHAVRARSGTWTRTCGIGRPGGDVPVDPADVVARLVRPDLGELGAAAEVVGPVFAGQQAADPAPDGQVERAEERLGRRAGPGTLRVRPRWSRGGAGRPTVTRTPRGRRGPAAPDGEREPAPTA